MASVLYDDIFSRFLGKITDQTILSKSDEEVFAMELEYLKASLSDVRVRNLFSSLYIDNELHKLKFELVNSADEASDEDFITELLAVGMVIHWMEPQVDSIVHIGLMIGGKEEKKLVDHYSHTIERLNSLKTKQYKMIRDYGTIYNSYIGGES